MRLGAKGYSIWVMPTGQAYEKLSYFITKLSKQYGTPVFEPHMTVLGNIINTKQQIEEKTAQLASNLSPYAVTIKDFETSDEYYRNLVARVHRTQTIMHVNEKARQIFDLQQIPPYDPHLSIIYGVLPEETKQRIIKHIEEDISETSFKARSFHIVSTDGNPKKWRRVKEFALSK